MYVLIVAALVVATTAENLLFVPRSSTSVVCPDKKHACPTGNTCCMLANQSYGCCPLPNATCCIDRKYCCPAGSKCLAGKPGSCVRGSQVFPSLRKTRAKVIMKKTKKTSITDNISAKSDANRIVKNMDWLKKGPSVSSVMCPDGQSECMDGQTCCPIDGGKYGCCPITDAVCCTDGKHCCPEGTTCDVSSGKCNRGDLTVVDWVEKVPAIITDVICPDGQSKCQTSQTCCKLAAGDYGCCPMPKAVCCMDNLHCCPTNTTCNLKKSSCDTQLHSQPMVSKVPAVKLPTVICPDGKSECPDSHGCCIKTNSTGYSCCPYKNGVCCTNSNFCCPKTYVCDEEPGICRIPYTYGFVNMSKKNIKVKPFY